MGAICYTFSSKKDHVLQCEEDENGVCRLNCKHVPISSFSKNFAREMRRFQNAVRKYGSTSDSSET